MKANSYRMMAWRASRVVAILAAVVVWTATAAQADPLTCGTRVAGPGPAFDSEFFPTSEPAAFYCETVLHHYDPGTNVSQLYEYNAYFAGHSFSNELTFDEVLLPMDLYLSAFFITPGNAAFLSRIPSGYEPETFFTTFGETWIYFYVEDLTDAAGDKPLQDTDYEGDWFQDILWFGDGEYNDPQVLHDPRGGSNVFENVITVPGSFDPEPQPPCDYPFEGCFPEPPCDDLCTDPVIVGSADDFSGTTVVDTVPEPATLWLVGVGLAGALARSRQRARRLNRQDPDPR